MATVNPFERSGLNLLSAMLILTISFVFHQRGGMERLAMLGQALARSLDAEAITDVVVQRLPRLVATDAAWVTKRVDGSWKALIGPSTRRSARPHARSRPRAGRRVVGGPPGVDRRPCVPAPRGCQPRARRAGRAHTAGPFTESRQRVLRATATLLGISLRNAQLFREVKDNSLRDGLTGCFNRTHALEVIAVDLRRARRKKVPVSLVMFDLDHFEGINDRDGHQCGDAVLAAVGAKMRECLRAPDMKGRYGGEEFVVLLPETQIDGAKTSPTTDGASWPACPSLERRDDRHHGQLRRHGGTAVRDRRRSDRRRPRHDIYYVVAAPHPRDLPQLAPIARGAGYRRLSAQ